MSAQTNEARDPRGTGSHSERTWSGDVSFGVAAWAGAAGQRRATAPPDPIAEADGADTDGADTDGADTDGADTDGADAEAFARRILLDALAERARSRDELAVRLAKKGVPGDLASALLDRFTEVGLIDDAAFARDWIEARQRSRGLATRALAQELRRKGVADEVAREALAGVDPESEEHSARALVRKRLRSLARVETDVAKRRLAGMLARKGYSSSLAFRVIGDELAAVRESATSDDAEEQEMPDFDP